MIQNNPARDWLNTEAWKYAKQEKKGAGMLEFAHILQSMGINPQRIRFASPILHPLFKAKGVVWDGYTDTVELHDIPHEWDDDNPRFFQSPMHTIFVKDAACTRRNHIGTAACLDTAPDSLEDENTTDYIAIRITFYNVPTPSGVFCMTTNHPGGFTPDQLTTIDDFIPALGRIAELHLFKELTTTLLQTYLGSTPSKMVMNGQIRRGDGIDIRSVIWFSDLRESSLLSMELPREEYLSLLNQYFDCVAGAVLDHGGEVLRYIGDAALAIFPAKTTGPETKDACERAMAAAKQSRHSLHALNAVRKSQSLDPIDFGIGLHLGEVTYGNIGVRKRLEFTVIGEAANRAARLQDQSKVFNHPVVVSKEFSEAHGGNWQLLGDMQIRNVETKVSVFAPDQPLDPRD